MHVESVVAGAGRSSSLNHTSSKSVERAARAEVRRGRKVIAAFFRRSGMTLTSAFPHFHLTRLCTPTTFSPFYTCDHADEMDNHPHALDVITIDSDDDDLEVTRPAPTRSMDLFV